MEQNITILNVMNYQDKKDGKSKTRVGFILSNAENMSENKSFIGFSELSLFYDGNEVFSKFTKDMIGKPLPAKFKTLQSTINPMKSRQVIESFKYAGSTISLL